MTHCLHGSDNRGKQNGFTALGKKIGTSRSTEQDTDYVKEHRPLKYLGMQTDKKDRKGRSVLMDCDCAMIDCLYDYAPGVRLLLVTCSPQ